MSGDFLHVFGVVQPCKTEDGEGIHPPYIPLPPHMLEPAGFWRFTWPRAFADVCAFGAEGYKLAVCSRKGVPQFGPPIPNPPTFKHNEYFRDFLLTKRTST